MSDTQQLQNKYQLSVIVLGPSQPHFNHTLENAFSGKLGVHTAKRPISLFSLKAIIIGTQLHDHK